MKKVVCVAAVAALSGCAYNAPTEVAPAYDVYSNYDEKVPGRFALYVDAEEMRGEGKVRGQGCSFHSYPIDARNAFRKSVYFTLENLTEYIEEVDEPLSQDQLLFGGYDAMVRVTARDYNAKLTAIQSFWSTDIEADVEVEARMQVDAIDGRALGVSFEGSGDSEYGAGAACEGGAEALGEATSDAIKDAMEQMGERISNARKLREDR